MTEQKTDRRRTSLIGIPVLLRGGTEIQTLHLVRGLQQLGRRTIVCCYHEHDPAMVDSYRQAGAEVMLLGLPRTRSMRGIYDVVKVLTETFRILKPEILHLQYITPGFLSVVSAWCSRVGKIVISIHYPSTMLTWCEKILFKAATHFARVTIANSLETERSWFGSSALITENSMLAVMRHGTIYNCIDIKQIDEILKTWSRDKARRGMSLDGFLVLSIIGRLSPEKGHEILFRALHVLRDRLKKIVLLIVGSGDHEESLRLLAADLHIDHLIRWCGAVGHHEIARFLQATDIIIVPSLFEGFGLAAAEAMAAGVPVIASSTGGLPEVIEHEHTGLLVTPGDAEALADAIQLLAGDQEKRIAYGNAGRRRVESLFSVERYQTSIQTVYDQLWKGMTDT